MKVKISNVILFIIGFLSVIIAIIALFFALRLVGLHLFMEQVPGKAIEKYAISSTMPRELDFYGGMYSLNKEEDTLFLLARSGDSINLVLYDLQSKQIISRPHALLKSQDIQAFYVLPTVRDTWFVYYNDESENYFEVDIDLNVTEYTAVHFPETLDEKTLQSQFIEEGTTMGVTELQNVYGDFYVDDKRKMIWNKAYIYNNTFNPITQFIHTFSGSSVNFAMKEVEYGGGLETMLYCWTNCPTIVQVELGKLEFLELKHDSGKKFGDKYIIWTRSPPPSPVKSYINKYAIYVIPINEIY